MYQGKDEIRYASLIAYDYRPPFIIPRASGLVLMPGTIFVDKANPSPDPGKRMLWGFDADGQFGPGDFKKFFKKRPGRPIEVPFTVNSMDTAHQVQEKKGAAIRSFLALYRNRGGAERAIQPEVGKDRPSDPGPEAWNKLPSPRPEWYKSKGTHFITYYEDSRGYSLWATIQNLGDRKYHGTLQFSQPGIIGTAAPKGFESSKGPWSDKKLDMVKVSLDAEAKEVLKTWPPRTSGSNEYFGTARPANMREITTEEYEAQDKRLAAEMMGITSIWDNGGKTADRYSVVTKEPAGGGNFMILGLSDDCYSPGGVNMFGDGKPGPHLGKKIKFEDLPSRVQACVIARLKED